MNEDWVASVPGVIYFIIGLGGLSGALLAIVKLWQTLRPPPVNTTERDVNTIQKDVHDIKTRLTALEIDVAKIDQPAIVKRFDGLENKIDRLYEFLLERFSDPSKDPRR